MNLGEEGKCAGPTEKESAGPVKISARAHDNKPLLPLLLK